MARKRPTKRQSQHAGRRGTRPRAGADSRAAADTAPRAAKLRIVGGSLRGRTIEYNGRFETRPMKDRTRESVFNLVGPAVVGLHAIDLFAGTGALGLEALSRGAARATFIERHVPTAHVIEQNIARFGLGEKCRVATGDAFRWVRRQGSLPAEPWLVLCSPPYSFYRQRQADMLALVAALIEAAPAGSILVVEAEQTFDPALLPRADQWDIRRYAPAIVAIYRAAD